MNGFHTHEFKRETVFLGLLPKIKLAKEVYLAMVCLTEMSDETEMGWLGSVEKQENNTYLIKEVFLFDQKVKWDEFKINPDALSDFYVQALSRPDGVEFVNSLRFIGHVEPGKDISFGSVHDDKIMKSYAKNKCDFFIQAIMVRSGEIQFTVYDYARQIIFRDVAWEVVDPEKDALKARLRAEVARKVRIEKPRQEKATFSFKKGCRTCPWYHLGQSLEAEEVLLGEGRD